MGREQPRIHPPMMGNRPVHLLQRYRAPRQIEVFILQAAGPTLLDPLRGPLKEPRAPPMA
ncbi:MAG: hypothetical protein GXY83_41120 [Rhodopirellula sp.]|nr:hypothetical protein [Rhodopirellula sp.]